MYAICVALTLSAVCCTVCVWCLCAVLVSVWGQAVADVRLGVVMGAVVPCQLVLCCALALSQH